MLGKNNIVCALGELKVQDYKYFTQMLLLPLFHSGLISHILFSANLDLVSELFSTETHVITDNQLLPNELKHICHFCSDEF